MVSTRILDADEQRIAPRHRSGAQALSDVMPRMVAEARRLSSSVVAGVHGRRRVGTGESFWQFRAFMSGESAARVDWRRSARDERLYVREREWEAAQTVWLWVDRSPSMSFQSSLARTSKLDRAVVLALAAADMLVRGGERVGLLGLSPAIASRRIIERLAEALVLSDPAKSADGPDPLQLRGRSEIVLIGDFISPAAEIEARLHRLAERGTRGHLMMIVDPAEALFPFDGQTEFVDPEDGFRLRVGEAAEFAAGYHHRIEAHREALRRAAASLGWTFSVQRTNRPATEALLWLDAAIGAKGTA